MKHLNALNTIYGLGGKKMHLLMDFFGESKKIWEASQQELIESGIGKAMVEKIVALRLTTDPEIEWAKLEKENVSVFSFNDNQYPELLRQIPDHPYIIYMKGDLACLDLPLIAVVGSRKLTVYGDQVARGLARDLARSGVCVVSGLAFGIDAMAHQGALDAKGRTIAVLGNSLDEESIYPRNNFQLSQRILASGGLLISEFPIKTRANRTTFPARNRIMAGMSLGTLVVEAAPKSGSLITANLALDYNRDVFAVPGSIFSPQSVGTHQLIKNGAKLVTSAKDILEELRLENDSESEEVRANISMTNDEKKLHSVLSHESVHIDRIAKLTKLDTSTISSMLAMMEIKGLIKNVGGQNYIRM